MTGALWLLLLLALIFYLAPAITALKVRSKHRHAIVILTIVFAIVLGYMSFLLLALAWAGLLIWTIYDPTEER